MSVYCTLFSQTFYGLLFCYLIITDVHVTLYLQIIDFQFPSWCTSQPPKKLNQIITVNSSTNTPRSCHQKNNSCTLCVPMFCKCYFESLNQGKSDDRKCRAPSTVFYIFMKHRVYFFLFSWKYLSLYSSLGLTSIRHSYRLSYLDKPATTTWTANVMKAATAATETH